jgi:integrase
MRQGEICSLTRADIDGRVARLSMTKNGDPRDVPLSSKALAIIEDLPDDLFGTTAARLSANWRNLCKRAAVVGLTFHDSRRAAVTRLAKKLDVLALAKIIGHRNLAQLRVYYEVSADELAGLLDAD